MLCDYWSYAMWLLVRCYVTIGQMLYKYIKLQILFLKIIKLISFSVPYFIYIQKQKVEEGQKFNRFDYSFSKLIDISFFIKITISFLLLLALTLHWMLLLWILCHLQCGRHKQQALNASSLSLSFHPSSTYTHFLSVVHGISVSGGDGGCDCHGGGGGGHL